MKLSVFLFFLNQKEIMSLQWLPISQFIKARLLSGNLLPFTFQSHTSASHSTSDTLTLLLFVLSACFCSGSEQLVFPCAFSLSYLHICMLFPSFPLGLSKSLYQNSHPWLYKRATFLLLPMTFTLFTFSPEPHLEPPKCTCAHVDLRM